MSTTRRFDRIAEAWLAEGPSELADRVLDAALEEVHLTNQRRGVPMPWRTPLAPPMRLAAAFALIAVIGLGALTVLRPTFGPAASPSPSISPAPSTTVFPINSSDWISYTSERYGFDIKRHPDFLEVPSIRTWQPSDRESLPEAVTENFVLGSGGSDALRVRAWSTPVAPGMTLERWAATNCQTPAYYCGVDDLTASAIAVTTADGHTGYMVTGPVVGEGAPPNISAASILVEDRVYLVVVAANDGNRLMLELGGTRRILEAVVSTITLRPGGPAPEGSTPALTQTFTSERYGYSINFPAGWTVEPAGRLWLPGSEQENPYDFLAPATPGLFRAASALIPTEALPSSVSVDDWIARTVWAPNEPPCGAARSTFSDIEIDGRIGKVAFNCGQVEATLDVDGRLYLFTLFLVEGEPGSIEGGRALFEAMIATVQLTPETAEVRPTSAP